MTGRVLLVIQRDLLSSLARAGNESRATKHLAHYGNLSNYLLWVFSPAELAEVL